MTEVDRARAMEERWRLAALEHTLDDAIVTAGLDTRIRTWSPGAERLYGYVAAQAIGQDLSLVTAPDHVGDFRALVRRVMDGEAVSPHVSVRRTSSGHDVEVEVRAMPLMNGERVVGLQLVDRDLTEQRRLSSNLDATVARLEAAVTEARAMEERSLAFLADAAHQLRSPMATIRVCTETLLQGVEPEEQDRLMRDLVRQTARAGRLIGSLLRMAHLDHGEELSPVPCDIVAVCGEEADRMWNLAPRLDVVVRATPLPKGPVMDVAAAREVVANLLENAVRYAASKVEVSITMAEYGVEVRITDDGPGLPAGKEELAFDRFVTFDASGGSGLGLPIARALVRAHSGDLTYEDGSFVVRLPF